MHYSRETYTHQQVPTGDNIVTIKAVTKEPVYETGRDLSQLIKITMYLFSTYCMLGTTLFLSFGASLTRMLQTYYTEDTAILCTKRLSKKKNCARNTGRHSH